MYFKYKRWTLVVLATWLLTSASLVLAQSIKIGVTLSATGPAASLGIPARQAIALWPKEIAGQKLDVHVLDDASDPTGAVKNGRKLMIEDKVDVLVGSSTTPASLALIEIAAEAETPLITLAASARLVEPQDAKRRWVFKVAANDSVMAIAVVQHMSDKGVKTAAYIGFADSYGESWLAEFKKFCDLKKIKIVAEESFGRSDTSVIAQVLKIMAARPDAVLVGAAGTPAVMPQASLGERGFKGLVYQTHGVGNNDFLRVGGDKVMGAYVPVGPSLVTEQLPASHPLKTVTADFVSRFEKVHGAGSRSLFAAQAYDVVLQLEQAIPKALKAAKPGSREFRLALRDALEGIRQLNANAGVFNFSPDDHAGLDQNSRVMVQVVKSGWKLEP